MTHDDIDRILSDDDDIVPSSGFTRAVLLAVREQAAIPPPIPFPWKRAWPYPVAAALLLLGGPALLFAVSHGAIAPLPASPRVTAFADSLFRAAASPDARRMVVACAVTLATVLFARRLGRVTSA